MANIFEYVRPHTQYNSNGQLNHAFSAALAEKPFSFA